MQVELDDLVTGHRAGVRDVNADLDPAAAALIVVELSRGALIVKVVSLRPNPKLYSGPLGRSTYFDVYLLAGSAGRPVFRWL